MPKRTVTEYPIDGRRVFLRVDFNVPLDGGEVADDTRIRAALPTITHLTGRGCRVVIASHLGRPKGAIVPELRMAPVAARLAELLGAPVATADDCIGPAVGAAAEALPAGGLLLLENLRFHAEETTNDPAFGAALAALADVYVNDAFGTAHRAHASTVGVPGILPGVAGLLMARELEVLGRLLADPGRPFVVVLGGAKVSDKIGVIEKMLTFADAILIGGAMCFPLLWAKGYEVGRSKVEEGTSGAAQQVLAAADGAAGEFVLPSDVVVARQAAAGAPHHTVAADEIPSGEIGLDIGAATVAEFTRHIDGAATVFWNGPMGLFEIDDFAAGTRAVAAAVAVCPGVTVVGGGDTVSAIRRFGFEHEITHVSTGGGASMEFLEGKPLPGVEALLDA